MGGYLTEEIQFEEVVGRKTHRLWEMQLVLSVVVLHILHSHEEETLTGEGTTPNSAVFSGVCIGPVADDSGVCSGTVRQA